MDETDGRAKGRRRPSAIAAAVVAALLLEAVVVGGLLAWAAGFPAVVDLFGPAPSWLANDPFETTRFALFALGGALAVLGLGLTAWRHQLEMERLADERLREARRQQELVDDRRERQEQEARRIQELREDRQEARERDEVAASARDADRRDAREAELRARYVSILDLLQSDESVTRTAGVYALGALADDWARLRAPAERQVCIDLLLDYVRTGSRVGDEEIRRTVFRLIQMHLHRDADSGERVGGSWSDADFNLVGMSLPDHLRIDEIRGFVVIDFPMAHKQVEVSTIGPGGHLRITGEHIESGLSLGDVSVGSIVGGEVSVFAVNGQRPALVSINSMREEASARVSASHIALSIGNAANAELTGSSLQAGSELRFSRIEASTIGVYTCSEVQIVIDGAEQVDCAIGDVKDSEMVLRSVKRSQVQVYRAAANKIEIDMPGAGDVDYADPRGVLRWWPPQRRRTQRLELNRFRISGVLNVVEVNEPDVDFRDLRRADVDEAETDTAETTLHPESGNRPLEESPTPTGPAD